MDSAVGTNRLISRPSDEPRLGSSSDLVAIYSKKNLATSASDAMYQFLGERT
jgi:hypothetical protein